MKLRTAAAWPFASTTAEAATTRVSETTTEPSFMKPLTPSADLAQVVGSLPLSRTAAVSQIWDYIKKHNLQDAANKRMINADAVLQPIFGGKKQVSMFEMAGFLGKHLS